MSSIVISLDRWRTAAATLAGPRLVVTLSNVSATFPSLITSSWNVSSPGSDASVTSTAMPACGPQCTHPEGRLGCVTAGGQLHGRPFRQLGLGGAGCRLSARDAVPHPHDIGRRAAVEEIPVDGMRQERPVDEIAERAGVLGPVRHEDRLVHRPLLGEADERAQRRADSLERLDPRGDLLDIDTG